MAHDACGPQPPPSSLPSYEHEMVAPLRSRPLAQPGPTISSMTTGICTRAVLLGKGPCCILEGPARGKIFASLVAVRKLVPRAGI